MKMSEKRLDAYRKKTAPDQNKHKAANEAQPKPGGFVKTVARKDKVAKTAKFLILVGKEESSEILRHLPEKMVEDVLREVAAIKRIDPAEAEAILAEFKHLKTKPVRITGGVDAARELLFGALGEEKGAALLARVLPETAAKPFSYLDDYPQAVVLKILKHETVPAVSMILPWVKPALGAALLKSYSPEDQRKIVSRIAVRRKLDREILDGIDARVKEKIMALGTVRDEEERDGREVLARILRHLSPGDEKRILGDLESEDASLGKAVREKLFTAETVLSVRDIDLQKLLEDYSEKDLALLLRDKKMEFREKITNNISLRRRTLVEEEDILLGQVRKSEAAAATRAFLEKLKEREEGGQLVIFRGEDQDLLE
jgi:flagellar motor switch protein FliG